MTNKIIYSKKEAGVPLIVVAMTGPESLTPSISISEAVSRAVSKTACKSCLHRYPTKLYSFEIVVKGGNASHTLIQ